MQPSDVRKLSRRTRKIPGWFSAEAASLFALIDEAQREIQVSGNLFEIGVHHGKSTVILCSLARTEEKVGVCDIFAGQSSNISNSGKGDRELFEANLSAQVPDVPVAIFETPSASLELSDLNPPIRLFHIDGGHLADEAYSDLKLASKSLAPGGAIVVDDPFRPEWPGVSEAIFDFLKEEADFSSLILGFNKLVLVPRSYHDRYSRYVERHAWDFVSRYAYRKKTQPICGVDTQIFFIPDRWQIARTYPSIARAKHLTLSVGRQLSNVVGSR
jgi:hypothetical protein